MAHTNSAEKRQRQAVKRTLRNRISRAEVKTLLKRTMKAIEDKDAAKAQAEFRLASRSLDKAAKIRAIHPNEASRRKSRLAKKVGSLSAKA